MGLRDKYTHAIHTAKELRMDGSAEERDGKLHFNGTVRNEDEKNRIWSALKTVPDWQKEVVADIRVKVPPQPQATRATGQQQPTATTHTVQPGDTLSAIARKYLGNANAYMDIFNANADKLSDPNVIRPGQVLTIPQLARK
jgi:nucleoid-associated protein YgaU